MKPKIHDLYGKPVPGTSRAERNPHWSTDETEHELNRILADLISYETVVRLVRQKEGK